MSIATDTGIRPTMPFPDYLSHDSWGSSSIRAFRNGTPAGAKWGRENRFSSTPAMILGTASHCAIMTPELWHQQIVVKPEGMTFQSKANKEWKAAQEAQGLEILTQANYTLLQDITAAFDSKPAARDALDNATLRESSVFWDCAESGLGRKCRPDWFVKDGFIYDLKISIDATKPMEKLMSSAYWNGWAHQLAGGREGLNQNGQNIQGGRLVVISSQPPHAARVWLLEVSGADCDMLELENQNTCVEIMECERTGNWPGTPDEWLKVQLPSSASWTELEVDGLEEAV